LTLVPGWFSSSQCGDNDEVRDDADDGDGVRAFPATVVVEMTEMTVVVVCTE
jgi:hypothetical protein